jgi:cellular nucleic acid-binding protein
MITKVGPNQHSRETSLASAQVGQAAGGDISSTIMGGDALADKAFKVVLRWIMDNHKSGESEDISENLSFTDFTHSMCVKELLAVPMVLKDQVYSLLARFADDHVPLADVQAVYAHATNDHPARAMVVEIIGKAYLEKRLKNGNAYYECSDVIEEFKKDLQQYLSKNQISGDGWTTGSNATAETQTFAGTTLTTSDRNAEHERSGAEASNLEWGPPTTMTAPFVPNCGIEASKHSEPSYLPTAIISFDGPADEWSTVGAATGDQWKTGATEWQDTSAVTGGIGDGWGTTGGGTTDNNNGWGDDTGGSGGAAVEDDNNCRRCKQSGHFARECPQPRDDSCFNCGRPGHISRDCTEPKKPRGSDRTCRKCNEIGHIGRDCPTGGDGGGDRACHKCNEVGHIARDCPTGGGSGGDRACHKCGEIGHFSRECTSSAFGAAAGGAGGGMKCYNCQQHGHKSSECTNEPVEREYGSDPRTCNKCGQKGHISRDCREDAGDSYSMQHGGGGYGEPYNSGYSGDGGYDAQYGLYDAAAVTEDAVEPALEKMVNITVSATRIRKGKKGRLGYVDITQQMYDPHAFEGAEYTSSYGGGGQRREDGGRGGRGGRGRGRGGGRGGHRNNGEDGGYGGNFAQENVPPPPAAPGVPAVAVEGDWANKGDGGDSSAPAASSW